jgi:hypothetical protein
MKGLSDPYLNFLKWELRDKKLCLGDIEGREEREYCKTKSIYTKF